MGGSSLTYLKYITYLKCFSSQIITSKVPSISGRALKCLEVSIDKVHTKMRSQRSRVRKSRANSVFTQTLRGYFDASKVIFTSALLARFPRDITTRHYLRWVSAKERGKKDAATSQHSRVRRLAMTSRPWRVQPFLASYWCNPKLCSSQLWRNTHIKRQEWYRSSNSNVVTKQKLIKMRKKIDSWTELNFNANKNHMFFLNI